MEGVIGVESHPTQSSSFLVNCFVCPAFALFMIIIMLQTVIIFAVFTVAIVK